jgi:hypothetical protein
VSHIGKGHPWIGASHWSSVGEPQTASRCDARVLHPAPTVFGGRGDNATSSSRVRAGSMTQAEVVASILERFNSPFGSIFDVGPGFASETAAACSARTRRATPPARRSVSRGRCAWTTPVGSPALSASRQLRSPSSSAVRATPSPPSPSPPARWICAGPEYWSRLKRFGTVATRCDGSSAAVPTGRLPRSANGFY